MAVKRVADLPDDNEPKSHWTEIVFWILLILFLLLIALKGMPW